MRTRFAPSPTGYLHIGGLRTALFAYLCARQAGGTFYVRIEDTDRERHVEGAQQHLMEMLRWAGLDIDDGPYVQSERLTLYQEHAQQLIDSGHAYHCFCSKERLDAMREEQSKRKQAPMYDRTCVNLDKEESTKRAANGEPHVVRFLVPRGKAVECNDHIRGKVQFKSTTLDDQVLLKSDGFPTYHLAHVVDDHLMDTSLVIRGEEWLPSLPKHLLLFSAFGWEPPEYAHVPLLLAKGGGKLSKRQGDVSMESFIEHGYLQEALLNFVALLGWNPGTEEEVFSMEELIKKFSLKRVQKGGAIFDTAKLDWLQGQWMRKMDSAKFAQTILPLVPAAQNDDDFVHKVALVQERITFFSEAPAMLAYFYEEPTVSMELLANKKQKVSVELIPMLLTLLIEELTKIEQWNEEALKAALEQLAQTQSLKRGQLLWPLRAALTGVQFSPGAYEVAIALGKEKTLERLQKCL